MFIILIKNKLNNSCDNLQVISNSFHSKTHYIVKYVDKNKLRENALLGADSIARKDVTKEKVMRLRDKGYTYPQIAKELGCGYNTVWRRLFT